VSELLDDLARSLSRPMPRRQAMRVLAGALVGAALPARALGAARVTKCRNPGDLLCQKCKSPSGLPYGGICCTGPDATKYWKCECTPYNTCVRIGCTGQECGNTCCKDTEYCADSSNSLCCTKGKQPCGKTCCDSNEVCADASRSLCCPSGKFRCAAYGSKAGGAGQATCCYPPEREYCTTDEQHAVCCERPSSLCDGKCCELPKVCVQDSKGQKVCKCPPGMNCGDKCCDKKEHCCPGNTHCCPEGKTCCGDTGCCDPGQVCTRNMQGEKPLGLGFCCSPSQAIGTSLCCKPGSFPKKSSSGVLQCTEIRKG
jgi:hypothetical protein